MSGAAWSLATRSAAETQAVGARLAATLPSVTRALILYLSGDLGAGKTTLARGFAQACGFAGVIKSPTYTLMECYATPTTTVVHLDLYRLGEPAELESLGIRDFLLPGHVWLIEWPERGAGRLPAADLSIALTVEPEHHHLAISASSDLGREWLARAAA